LRLPTYTAGHELEYLVTTPDESTSMDVFSALYDYDALTIAQWLGPSLLEESDGMYSANDTISGLSASVIETQTGRRPDERRRVADLTWRDGDVNYHLWYYGSVAEARRIAESIPRQ
jgi:hypothetical protein